MSFGTAPPPCVVPCRSQLLVAGLCLLMHPWLPRLCCCSRPLIEQVRSLSLLTSRKTMCLCTDTKVSYICLTLVLVASVLYYGAGRAGILSATLFTTAIPVDFSA
ncbi:hypothetical protein ABBQ38_000773 [Trebouxia sp. C0009 RCD-2024]